MVIADTLLRYSPEDTPEILLDISVNHVYCLMQTMRGNYSSVSSVQNISGHMFLVDTSQSKVTTNH